MREEVNFIPGELSSALRCIYHVATVMQHCWAKVPRVNSSVAPDGALFRALVYDGLAARGRNQGGIIVKHSLELRVGREIGV